MPPQTMVPYSSETSFAILQAAELICLQVSFGVPSSSNVPTCVTKYSRKYMGTQFPTHPVVCGIESESLGDIRPRFCKLLCQLLHSVWVLDQGCSEDSEKTEYETSTEASGVQSPALT